MRVPVLCVALVLTACGGPGVMPQLPPDEVGGGGEGRDAGGESPDGGAPDAGSSDAGPSDAGSDGGTDGGPSDGGASDGGTDGGPVPTGVAPPGAVAGEKTGGSSNSVTLAASASASFRVDAEPTEHVAFKLTFPSTTTGVTLDVRRWSGSAPVQIGLTDAGKGLRFLAAFDPSERRTFWARVKTGSMALSGATLEITRTSFRDGLQCESDCARLLQLPLPNDPAKDGYSCASSIFRYQFGRRDLLQFLRYTGRKLAEAGKQPFHVADLSQWDGDIPGTDTGSLRHVSHTRGKDVDLALYGTDGKAIFRSYCQTTTTSDGRVCIAGTRKDFDAVTTAAQIGLLYESGRVTMDFLDRELIAVVKPGAQTASGAGLIASWTVPLFSDGKHLQHWPNHDNHVHVRVSESTTGVQPENEPFEAP